MLPRNVVAIRKGLASGSITSCEIITSLTHKNSHAVLFDYPTGAYTGMRTFDKIGILDFTGHTTRLANSLQQIRFPGTNAGNGGDAHKDLKSEDMTHDEYEDPVATAGLAELRRQETMKKETTDLVRAGLKFYYKQLREDLQEGEHTHGTTVAGARLPEETKVTVLCTWDAKVKEATLVAHFEPLKTPKMPRCKVEIHGSPRHHATAKDSQWVRDRQELEEALDKDSNEALLIDNETQDVYEGLSSNFYAFDKKRRTLLTAPMGTVLQGTLLKVILNVCNVQNIPVDYTFPNLKRIDEWEGAFISSTSRLVLPIEKLVLPDGSVKMFEESPTIELIRIEALKECRKRVENLITEQDV